MEQGRETLDDSPPPGSPSKVDATTLTLVRSVQAEMNDKMAPGIKYAGKPYWERTYVVPESETVLGGAFVSDFSSAGRKLAIRDAQLHGGLAQVAVERYRLREGRLPESLDALVPEFLESVPTDPFDGQPMRYGVEGDGYRIHSVGPDGEDGGGVERIDRDTDAGDIILWPWGPALKPRRSG